MCVDQALTGTSVRQPDKSRKNTDYLHKKKYKRKRNLPAVTLTAVRNTGNPNRPNIIKYDNDMYMIGDHTDPANPLGIAQYLNCAIKTSGYRNNCKLVKVAVNTQKMYVTKVTAPTVNVGEQLFTPYGRGRIIPKHAIRQSRPPSLIPTTVPSVRTPATQLISIPALPNISEVEVVPHITPILPKHYGYSADSLGRLRCALKVPGGCAVIICHTSATRPSRRRRQLRIC